MNVHKMSLCTWGGIGEVPDNNLAHVGPWTAVSPLSCHCGAMSWQSKPRWRDQRMLWSLVGYPEPGATGGIWAMELKDWKIKKAEVKGQLVHSRESSQKQQLTRLALHTPRDISTECEWAAGTGDRSQWQILSAEFGTGFEEWVRVSHRKFVSLMTEHRQLLNSQMLI